LAELGKKAIYIFIFGKKKNLFIAAQTLVLWYFPEDKIAVFSGT
jgi:hypothetical protein